MKSNEQLGELSGFVKKKAAKAMGIALLGSVVGAGAAQAEDISANPTSPAATKNVRGSKENSKINLNPETESDWMELARRHAGGAMSKLKQIEHAPFAHRVAEIAIDSEPITGIVYYESYSFLLGADKLLEQSVIQTLGLGERGAFWVFTNPDNIKHLKNFTSYYQEAAEKTPAYTILGHLPALFENLPKSFAESIAQNACNYAQKEYPIQIVFNASKIRQYLPGSKFCIDQAINYLVEKDMKQIWENIASVMEALQEEERASFTERVTRLDPVGAYQSYHSRMDTGAKDPETGKLKLPANNYSFNEFNKITYKSNSAEAVVIRRIFEAEIPHEIKYKLPLIMDELVFNKRFTLEEAVKIVQDRTALMKLIGEITHRKNYIGRESIKDFLSTPIKNEIVNED